MTYTIYKVKALNLAKYVGFDLEYYILDNGLGYIDLFHFDEVTQIIFAHLKPCPKLIFKPIATKVVNKNSKQDQDLHAIFIQNPPKKRLTELRANEIIRNFGFKKLNKNKKWLEVYYPNKNSSTHALRKYKKESKFCERCSGNGVIICPETGQDHICPKC